ncbi:chemotaxis protein CheB [Desulfobacterales bacterium HSG16]|nr:chemotaxis protein CheB [Desulfobacterales bacterium HSG16]
MNRKIRALIVDDTAFMRKALAGILETDPMIEVVGRAANGLEALGMIEELEPDVITLDIDMPVMDGLAAIRHIMIEIPVPIVVLSSLFMDGAVTFEALRLGVADFVPKPSGAVSVDIEKARQKIVDRVKIASTMNMDNVRRVKLSDQWGVENRLKQLYKYYPLEYIIALGTTLSGPNTIIRLLSSLSPTIPASMVVIQEISPKILSAFVKQFDEHVPWRIRMPEDESVMEQGVCYICSNEQSLTVGINQKGEVVLRKGPKIPEPLNVMFSSAADVFHQHTIGILLSGMGDDGAEGFARIKQAFGMTMVKDSKCCVFPNLTDNAIEKDVVDLVLDDRRLVDAISAVMAQGI